MLKNLKLLSVIVIIAIISCQSNAPKSTFPNIVFIMADDMGYECLSCNGALSYSTPNLDRLAQEGIRFQKCISQPLCTPSRVKIMTGKYNYRNYKDFAYMDPKERTFGNLVKEAGYKTMVAGKWQLNGIKEWSNWEDRNRPVEFGFDEYCLWQLTYRGERYPKPYMEQNGEVLNTTIDDYGPDIACNYVLDFIERNRDKPFFVYYPMILVHNPFRPTPDSPEWADSSKRMDSDEKYFKDMVEYTDKIVGKIDAKLKELGLQQNTILIFTGDNGTNSAVTTNTVNGPYQGGKGTTPDAGTLVPLIVKWPDKVTPGQVTDNLVDFSDFLPTFAEAVNGNAPKGINGKSFFKLLTGGEYTPRKTVFVHFDPKMKLTGIMKAGRFVRDKKYKLYHDGKFYDLENDNNEKNPLNLNQLTDNEKRLMEGFQKELDKAPLWNYVNENYRGDLKQKNKEQ